MKVDYLRENKSYVCQYNEKLELMVKYNKMVLNAQNHKQVRAANEMITQFHREDTIQKSKKWELFREARLVMMDRYIQVKKRCHFAFRITRLVSLVRYLKRMYRAHVEAVEYKVLQYYAARLGLFFVVRMRRKIKRHGNVEGKWRNYCRTFLTLGAHLHYEQKYNITSR